MKKISSKEIKMQQKSGAEINKIDAWWIRDTDTDTDKDTVSQQKHRT